MPSSQAFCFRCGRFGHQQADCPHLGSARHASPLVPTDHSCHHLVVHEEPEGVSQVPSDAQGPVAVDTAIDMHTDIDAGVLSANSRDHHTHTYTALPKAASTSAGNSATAQDPGDPSASTSIVAWQIRQFRATMQEFCDLVEITDGDGIRSHNYIQHRNSRASRQTNP